MNTREREREREKGGVARGGVMGCVVGKRGGEMKEKGKRE